MTIRLSPRAQDLLFRRELIWLAGVRGPGLATAGTIGVLGMDEFVAPKPFSSAPFVVHEPYAEVTSGKPVLIRARILGVDSADKVILQVSRGAAGFGGGGQGRMMAINMTREDPTDYSGEIAAASVMPGLLEYRIIIHRASGEWIVFPRDHKGDPFAWDNINTDHWQTAVAGENSPLEIFDPAVDRDINIYPSFGRGFQAAIVPGPDPGRWVMRLTERGTGNGAGGRRRNASEGDLSGFQYFFADKLKGRAGEAFDKLFIRARSGEGGPVRAKVTLTDADARSFSTYVTLGSDFHQVEVPLDSMVEDAALLLPRPYPGFLPLQFKATGSGRMPGLMEMERVQVLLDAGGGEIESIWFGKNQKAQNSVIK